MPRAPAIRPRTTRPASAPVAPKRPQNTTAPRRAGTADAFTPAASTGGKKIPASQGSRLIETRAEFEKLARRDDVPGALGAREMKFLMTGVDGPNPQLYFINTKNIVYHYDFATRALKSTMTLQQFNKQTYFNDDRQNLAGTLVAHDNFERSSGKKGLYAMEFWPTDPVAAKHVAIAYKAITEAMPFAKGQIAYHPAGDTHEAQFAKDKAKLTALGVKSVSTTKLFEGVSYSPLNTGVGFGTLRLIDPSAPDQRPPTARDVVIFKSLPNDLTHVGGVISETPQTPLSHVNLKCKQNDTPNAFLKDASTDPNIQKLIGKMVRYEVTPDGVKIREATAAEAQTHLDSIRPTKTQYPPRDLSIKTIRDLDALTHADVNSVGAKAANVAELRDLLGPDMVPDGYAIPFSFYDDFMKANGLYDAAKQMMADPRFKSDAAFREQALDDFREKIEDAPVPASLETQLVALQKKFPPGMGIRCRSSTNNEDLEGFNGAGLYDSFTHRPDEGKLSKSVKDVWASLWNYRAYEERDFHRIDHLSAAMGVLVHPNYDDELANGVAVTKNIYDPNWPGHYVNVQVGESLVTNPDPSAGPDEFLVSAIGEHGEWETQYIRHSNLLEDGKKAVLTPAQVKQLTAAMEKIQGHFKEVYGRQADPSFAMDLEFKIDGQGKLIVKQARPWVD